MDAKQLDNLIERVKREEDEKAFAAFYEATKDGLYAYLLGIVKKRELAEDLMQDAYIKLRQSVQSYQSGTNPRAYLTQIAKNLAFNMLKRAGYETAVDYQEFEVASKVTVEEQADTHVLDTINKNLTADEAQIVLLYLVSGFKHREIAEIVGKPLGTVLWSYNNSLKKLKKILKEEDN